MATVYMKSQSRYRRRPPHGFTLIELLVVVSIIALLVAILLPALSYAREQAKRVVCASNIHQLVLGVILYGENNEGKLPGRSGYEPHTNFYFRPGPGGPESNVFGDFSGVYSYVHDSDVFYCPSGYWESDDVYGQSNPGGTVFYGFTVHGIWGRYSTYAYMGSQTDDFMGNSPPVDIDGQSFELASSLTGPPNSVLLIDSNGYNGYTSTIGDYDFTNHPSQLGSTSPENWPPYERNGLNVGLLNGSAEWRDEDETVARYQWRPGWWYRY